MPPQHNPYAQPSPYAPQGYYAPGAPPPGAAQPGGGRGGRAGRAVLWAVVGAAVASALWGGGVLLLGGSDSASADLRGYRTKSDLCATADLSAFEAKYPQADSTPTGYTAKGESLDRMSCDKGLEMAGSSYADAYLSIDVDLHKKSDPAPEFADAWLGYKQHGASYVVTPVGGFGDEAYLVTEDTVTSGSGDREVILAVRDGWMTYSMSWRVYVSSYDTDQGKTAPTVGEATEWVKAATRATLAKLRS
ncbi:hypothetical protein [Streptomyces sp.]|uniref:hypothetical protein n=1 Tax=Streptomyces sp. TaxID=1931 RepID=UPI002F3FD1B8